MKWLTARKPSVHTPAAPPEPLGALYGCVGPYRMLAPKMAETADFELVQAVRGMDGRISDPSARMTSKMDRSKQRRGLGNPMAKSREVRTGTLREGWSHLPQQRSPEPLSLGKQPALSLSVRFQLANGSETYGTYPRRTAGALGRALRVRGAI